MSRGAENGGSDAAGGALQTTRAWRLAITLLGPLAVALAQRIPLPGIDVDAWASLQSRFVGFVYAAPAPNLTTVGIQPILVAAVVVEMAAWLVPRWRPLRHGGHEGRRKLWRATMALGLVLAAYYAAQFADVIAEPPSVLVSHGTGPWLMLVATSVGATCCFVLLAQLISARGLANGFVVLLISLWGCDGFRRVAQDLSGAPDGKAEHGALAQNGLHLGVLLTSVVLVIVATLIVLRPRSSAASSSSRRTTGCERADEAAVDGHELASGFAPVSILAQAMSAWGPLAVLGLYSRIELRMALQDLSDAGRIVFEIGLAVVSAVVLALGFYWPSRVARALRRAGGSLHPHAPAVAVATSVAFVLSLVLAEQMQRQVLGYLVGAPFIALTTALLVDMVREWRARGECGPLVSVWPEQRPYLIAAARQALSAVGIELYARHAAQRALLQGFGPYVPIELTVASEQATRAQQVLEGILPLPARRSEQQPSRGSTKRTGGAPMGWRWRTGGLLLVALVATGGWFGASRLATSLAPEAPAQAERVTLEFIALDDEADPLAPVTESADSGSLPQGLSFAIENAPIGPGRFNPSHYARLRAKGDPPPDLLSWLETVPRPEGTRLLLGRFYEEDETGELVPAGWRTYLATGDPVLTAAHVRDARAQPQSEGPLRGWVVALEFTDEGAERFARHTHANVKRRIAIVLDGVVESAPVIQSGLDGGRVQITMGPGSEQEQLDDARRLEAALRAGVSTRRRGTGP